GGGVPEARVAFGSNDEMVVLCNSQEDKVNHPHDVKVHALAIETRTGRVIRTLDWTGYGSSTVFATAAGNYAILRKGTALYGPGLFKELAHSANGVEMMSPNGGRFAARTTQDKKAVWVTIDGETLGETGSLGSFYKGSISDKSVASLWLGLPNSPFVRI